MGKTCNLDSFLELKEENGVKVASWAKKRKPSIAFCTVCQCEVSFSQGSRCLTNHSQREKHTSQAKVIGKENLVQLTVAEALAGKVECDNKEKEERDKTTEFEISLVRSLSNHKISNRFLDCLESILKKHCGESVVVQRMKLKRDKGNYMAEHGIGKTYQAETIKYLKECDAFSIGFDESEINKECELEVLVKLAHKTHGILLRHYRTFDLYSGTAECITQTILNSFDEDGVDYKKKMIATMTDGCATMEGKKSGVKKRMKDEVEGLKDLGSCNGHHISNSIQHGATDFCPDMQEVLVDLYQDIGGAKGKGTKKMKEFQKVCEEIGLKPKKIKKYCSTRFRTYRLCLEPVEHNWEGLVAYYSKVKKATDRQKRLQQFFVEKEVMSLLQLKFLLSATQELIAGIDFFEKRTELLHSARSKMEDLLRRQILKFHDDPAVKNLDEEENTASKKSGPELLKVDLDDKETLLSKRRVFIGQGATKVISDIGLKPDSPQLDWFLEAVFKFHKKVAQKLIGYFQTALNSTDLDYMSSLAPEKRTNMLTSYKLKFLAKSFPKVVDNIRSYDGMDRLEKEIDLYTVDDSIKSEEVFENVEEMKYEEYWEKVEKLKEGDWERYEIPPRFAKALGTVFNSNSETERAFSVQSDIHRNPKKNTMSQGSFDSHMQIHYGVESKQSRVNCQKCIDSEHRENPVPHCHCCVAEITGEMRVNCREASRSLKKEEEEIEEGENTSKELTEKQSKTKQAMDERKLKFKTDLQARSTFYRPSIMERIYPDKKKKKSDSETSTKSSKSSSKSESLASKTSSKSSSKSKSSASETSSKSSKSSAKSKSGFSQSSVEDLFRPSGSSASSRPSSSASSGEYSMLPGALHGL